MSRRLGAAGRAGRGDAGLPRGSPGCPGSAPLTRPKCACRDDWARVGRAGRKAPGSPGSPGKPGRPESSGNARAAPGNPGVPVSVPLLFPALPGPATHVTRMIRALALPPGTHRPRRTACPAGDCQPYPASAGGRACGGGACKPHARSRIRPTSEGLTRLEGAQTDSHWHTTLTLRTCTAVGWC